MSIVTVAEFKTYAKKMDADAPMEALYQTFVDAAEDVVAEFLTYSPAEDGYVHTFFGDGKPYLALRARPVTLTELTVDGIAQNVADLVADEEIITNKYGVVFPVGSVIIATYTGGFPTVPGVIKIVILEIASLLSMEAGDNIGVSSTSFDGGNTRNFVNYTNFDKYLAKLERYRIRTLPRMRP